MGVRVVFPDMGKDPSVQLIEKTITENGTYDAITDGANGYSKVNVNVEGGGGSSDFSTANVTLTIGDVTSHLGIQGVCILEYDGVDYLGTSFPIAENTTSVIPAVLYKGEGVVLINTSNTVTLGGNIHQVTPNAYSITGDCTITIS